MSKSEGTGTALQAEGFCHEEKEVEKLVFVVVVAAAAGLSSPYTRRLRGTFSDG